MGKQQNAYPLRVDKNILEKLKLIAEENGRSLNKEIEAVLKNAVKEYEAIHGEIIANKDSKKKNAK